MAGKYNGDTGCGSSDQPASSHGKIGVEECRLAITARAMLLEGIHWHFKLFQGKGADSKAAVWHTIIAVRDANTA